jgi:magnesium transporter
MDGFEVMESLKEIEHDNYLPVIVITSQADYKLRALQLGARDFISMPLDRAEVLARARNLLEVRLLHQESKDQSKALAQKVREVEASHEEIRRQSEEVRQLYDDIVAEQKRSMELSLQPGAMVGVENEERLATSWYRSLRLRHPWLQLNLFTAFVAAAVVGIFQGTIDRLLVLTVFLPVLAGQSGNTGSQALAITLRGMALGDLKTGKEKALMRKEALLGLLNGALVGLVAAIGMYLVASSQHLASAPMLSAVVFLAMIGSCIISGICGAFVPLALKRFGADPVTASSIFLTTATDVVSMGMLLGLASILVK